MSWVKEALQQLAAQGWAEVRPLGHSMHGRIQNRQLVRLEAASFTDVAVDDVVFVRWKGGYLLHLVGQKGDNALLLVNSRGKVNGWVAAEDVLARVTAVLD